MVWCVVCNDFYVLTGAVVGVGGVTTGSGAVSYKYVPSPPLTPVVSGSLKWQQARFVSPLPLPLVKYPHSSPVAECPECWVWQSAACWERGWSCPRRVAGPCLPARRRSSSTPTLTPSPARARATDTTLMWTAAARSEEDKLAVRVEIFCRF